MPQIIPIAIGVIGGAVQGGGAAAAAAGGLTGMQGAILGGALGAAVGALGLITQHKPHTARPVDDQISTTSIRNLVVPVVFGRGRIGGNYLALGNFYRYKTDVADNGGQVYLMNAIIGLCEGPIQFAGNRLIEGRPEKNFDDNGLVPDVYDAEQETYESKPHGLARDNFFTFHLLEGTNTQEVPGLILDTGLAVTAGFTEVVNGERVWVGSREKPVPWRNTAIEEVQAVAGRDAHLLQVSRDVVGEDFTIRLAPGSTSGTNFGDTAIYAYYDGYSESFSYTLSASSSTSAPFGLVRISRTHAFGHQHTQPPTAVTASVTKAWYLGRHDILVMQDPADDSKFWLGYWGISRGSASWEAFTPDTGYAEPIAAEYLDELHGILHTLHEDDVVFILRWNLLTGRVERIDTDLPGPSYRAFMYSADLDAYIVINDDTVMIVSADTGETLQSTTEPNLSGTIGVCTSGARVGIVKTDSFIYWDFNDNSLEAFGASGTGLTAGNFGNSVSARQNSWTGHVTLAKPAATTAAMINFIPSIIENIEDVSAMGTTRGIEFQWDYDRWEIGQSYIVDTVVFQGADGVPANQFDRWRCIADNTSSALNEPGSDDGAAYWQPWDSWMPVPNTTSDFVRDWSYRTHNDYSIVALQGNSSLAGAMWAACVDQDGKDYSRWGGGLAARHFALSSFESLHAFCVGGVAVQNPRKKAKKRLFFDTYEIDVAGDGDILCCWESPDDLGVRTLAATTPPAGWHYAWGDDKWILYGNFGEWRLKLRCNQGYTFLNVGPLAPTDGTWTNESGGEVCRGDSLALDSIVGVNVNPESPLEPISYRWSERAKFDFTLDNETPLPELLASEMLAAVNGYQVMIDGKYHVGVRRPGAIPAWLFNEHNINANSVEVNFVGRAGTANRIRVQYTNVRDDYRKDFAESNDEFDQNARSRVVAQTINTGGIARNSHGQWLAQTVLDEVRASRRLVDYDTSFLGLAFVPGDLVEVSHESTGLSRTRVRIVSLSEKESREVGLSTIEQAPILAMLKDADTGNPNDPNIDDPQDPTIPGNCEPAVGSTGSGVAWFDDGGTYVAGVYYLNYVGGAYRLSLGGGFAVEGYDLVTADADGNVTVLAACPAVANPDDGYATAGAAETANAGATVTVSLATAGPLGIRLRHPPAYSNSGAAGNPMYELCREKPTCESCPGECDEGCTEPANCGDCWFAQLSKLTINYAVALNGATSTLPSSETIELKAVGVTDGKARWGDEVDDGPAPDFATDAEYDCVRKILVVRVIASNGDRFVFAGTAGCAGATIALDPDQSIFSGDGAPTGSAVAVLNENPNPGDGADCLSAKGCGTDTRSCDFSIDWDGGSEGYHRVIDLSYLWDQLGLDDADTLPFTVMWDSDRIPDQFTITDALGNVLLDSGCTGTNTTNPIDGRTFHTVLLTKAAASGVILHVDPNCDPMDVGRTGWHLEFRCADPGGNLQLRDCASGVLLPASVDPAVFHAGDVVLAAIGDSSRCCVVTSDVTEYPVAAAGLVDDCDDARCTSTSACPSSPDFCSDCVEQLVVVLSNATSIPFGTQTTGPGGICEGSGSDVDGNYSVFSSCGDGKWRITVVDLVTFESHVSSATPATTGINCLHTATDWTLESGTIGIAGISA
jgi:hypothetical protein